MTPEEAIKIVHCCMHIGNDDILQARNMAISALEKQIPKKPEKYTTHCEFCGQALDWSGYDDGSR